MAKTKSRWVVLVQFHDGGPWDRGQTPRTTIAKAVEDAAAILADMAKHSMEPAVRIVKASDDARL